MNRAAIKQRFNIIGETPKLNQAIDVAIQVAPTEVSVLVIGENGTGKDVFSKIIHQLSKRKHKNFIAINCGAIPEGTIDSELFGHEKGSFTSAYESRKGYFEEVNGGTIFLDEIAEMPTATQARLLRVLENGEFIRVGSSKVQKTDVRIIAATNKNLIEAIRNGKFREDLYFRLNTVTVYVPPLRERGNDLERLFRFFGVEFGERYGRVPVHPEPEAMKLLYSYHWPGNIRELRNFVEKLTVLVPRETVTQEEMEDLLPVQGSRLPVLHSYYQKSPNLEGDDSTNNPISGEVLGMFYELRQEVKELRKIVFALMQPSLSTNAFAPENNPEVLIANNSVQSVSNPTSKTVLLEESLSLEKKEKDMIVRALNKHHNNRKRAAMELGISERTLYRKIKNYDLDTE